MSRGLDRKQQPQSTELSEKPLSYAEAVDAMRSYADSRHIRDKANNDMERAARVLEAWLGDNGYLYDEVTDLQASMVLRREVHYRTALMPLILLDWAREVGAVEILHKVIRLQLGKAPEALKMHDYGFDVESYRLTVGRRERA